MGKLFFPPSLNYKAMAFIQSMITFTFLAISVILPLYMVAYIHLLILSRRYTQPPRMMLQQYPKVSVHLPIFNEKHVVGRLIEAVCNLIYPSSKLEIVIIDDSVDETSAICEELVRKYRAKGINIVHIKRSDRSGFKAGALQYALQNSSGEFIAIFDADFIPQPNFLIQILHYFTDSRIGVVQARWGHLNRDYSPLTAAQALSLDLHFTIEQRGRSSRYFLNFNGTAGVWRRACIEDAGGWINSLAEDLDLSYRAQLKGWRIVYVDDLIVPAEVPVQMKAVRRQQYRWAYGSIQTAIRYMSQILLSRIPSIVKIHVLIHLTRHLPQLLLTAQVLMIPLVISSGIQARLDVMLGWMALYPLLLISALFITARTYYKKTYHSLLKFVKDVLLMFVWGMGMSVNNSLAVIRAFLKKDLEFERTPKFGIVGKKGDWRASSYALLNEPNIVFDIAMGVYSLYASLYCFYTRAFYFLPLTILYSSSLFYTVFASIIQTAHRSKQTHSRPRTTVLTIALAAVFVVIIFHSFAAIVYPIEMTIAAIERASSSVDNIYMVKHLDDALAHLPSQGNPVWLLPTASTDYQLIRHDLQSIKIRLANTYKNDYLSYHSVTEDARYALTEVLSQLRRLQPFAWLSLWNLSASLIAVFSLFYFTVKESHA
ncbi:Beta-monoglucosyldiacylglycerol synthase [Candidatus Calditenuaceae archaeon HR02]|nr:Beta-monoglucosyldiacylglycerol synthase [Candidatus Calditenuaceae archaeon HR02]